MKKSAVIFMLIFALLAAAICAGCGAEMPAGAGAGADTGADAGASAGAGADTGVGAGAGAGAGKADGSAGGHDNSGQPEGAAGEAGRGSGIPDTDASAVTDWGVADAGEAESSGGKITGGSKAGSGKAGGSKADGDKAGGSSDAESGAGGSFGKVIADREDLYFAIKEVRTDTALGYVWKVYVENRTDENLMFSFEKVSVNGVMCDPYWAEVVTAGKKGNCEIIWMRDALEERQISAVTEVGFTLNVYNDDDYTEAPRMHDPFTVYPPAEGGSSGFGTGGSASDADGSASDAGGSAADADGSASAAGRSSASGAGESFPAAPVPADPVQVLVDDEICTVMVTGYDPDNSWGYAMKLFIQNRSGEDLVFSSQNTSVNGIMCEPYWSEIVVSGKSAISTILWDKASLKENGITEVKEISLPLRVYSDQNIAEPYVDETFALKP